LPQWEGACWRSAGQQSRNRSGKRRRFEPTASRAHCVYRANRQCYAGHHSHYDPLDVLRGALRARKWSASRPDSCYACGVGWGGGTGTGGRSAQGWRAARISAPYGPQCYTTGCSKRGGGGGFPWPSRQSQHQTQNRAPDGVLGDRGPEPRSSTDGRSVPPHRLPLLRKRSRTYIRTGVIMSLFGQTDLPPSYAVLPRRTGASKPAARSAPALTRHRCPKRGPITMLGHPDMEPTDRYGLPSSPRTEFGSPDLLELIP
jgi:hypothetical protein